MDRNDDLWEGDDAPPERSESSFERMRNTLRAYSVQPAQQRTTRQLFSNVAETREIPEPLISPWIEAIADAAEEMLRDAPGAVREAIVVVRYDDAVGYRAANPFGITTLSQRRIALILDEAAEAAVEEALIEAH